MRKRVLVLAESKRLLPTWKIRAVYIRERMEALGGQIYIESSPGKGTQATVVVPLMALSNPDSKEIPKPLNQ